MWNPDDPVRHVGVRNEMAKADSETQRDAAKLAGQVQHDPCMSAAAGVLESAGISGPQPRLRRRQNAKLRPRQPARRTRERSLTLREPEELHTIIQNPIVFWQPLSTKLRMQPRLAFVSRHPTQFGSIRRGSFRQKADVSP